MKKTSGKLHTGHAAPNPSKMKSARKFSRRTLFGAKHASQHPFVMGSLAAAGLRRQPRADDQIKARRMPPPFVLKIFQRGAADGLTILSPYLDPDYQNLRSQTRIFAPGMGPGGDVEREAVPLANSGIPSGPSVFGLPKAMAPLQGIYDAGRLAFVHGIGNVDGVQSHFAAQDSSEAGGNQIVGLPPDGWLSRHLESKTDHLPGSFRAISYGSLLKRSLLGTTSAAPVPDPTDHTLPNPLSALPGWSTALETARQDALEAAHASLGDPLQAAFTGDEEGVKVLSTLDFGAYQPQGGAVYPTTQLGGQLLQAAQIAKETAVEIMAVDSDSWDTHSNQGVYLDTSVPSAPVPGGMYGRMQELADALRAFEDDMAASNREYIVLVVTEFGRKVPENSSAGTDHGKGGVAMVMGTGVKGGKVYGTWAGLDAASLAINDNDLGVTTDIRALYWEIATRGLGNRSAVSTLFPGQSAPFPPVGVL